MYFNVEYGFNDRYYLFNTHTKHTPTHRKIENADSKRAGNQNDAKRKLLTVLDALVSQTY